MQEKEWTIVISSFLQQPFIDKLSKILEEEPLKPTVSFRFITGYAITLLTYLAPIYKWLFSAISASDSFMPALWVGFNPQNTQCIPAGRVFVFIDLVKNISFQDENYLEIMPASLKNRTVGRFPTRHSIDLLSSAEITRTSARNRETPIITFQDIGQVGVTISKN